MGLAKALAMLYFAAVSANFEIYVWQKKISSKWKGQ